MRTFVRRPFTTSIWSRQLAGRSAYAQPICGRLDDLQTVVLGRHLAMPYPHYVAAGVDLASEIEPGLGRHHPQDATGQGGMFGMVLSGYARVVDVDIEVDAFAARAAADFNIGQGAGRVLDPLQGFVGDADALGVAVKASKS